MINQENESIVNKAIANTPDWLVEDLESIAKKESLKIRRISYVISELYSRYSFSFRHITSSMNQSTEWATTSHDRLNFIDNNLDLIEYIVKRMIK